MITRIIKFLVGILSLETLDLLLADILGKYIKEASEDVDEQAKDAMNACFERMPETSRLILSVGAKFIESAHKSSEEV